MATDKRFIVKNGLQTENINFVFNDAVLGSSNITATMLSSNTLSFSGSTGQLFSITDSMTGVIFAVNDISGVPSIEVYDDGRVYFAETFGNVSIGNSAISSSRTSTSTTTGILQVAGGVGITGNINVGGTRNLFTGSVGIGTSTPLGTNANVFSVYGSAMIYGNLDLANPTGGTSGIYFSDGTYQTTAATSATSTPSFGPVGTVQYAAAGNTFAGNGSAFFWDAANARLGIGTNAPANILTVVSTTTPAWFNTINSAVGTNNYEIIVGNGTSTGTTIGYVNNTAVPYGYISTGTNTRNISVSANGRVGIGGVTAPQVMLDVGGGAVIGASWAGNSNFINPPANGLGVQGSVGIGTYTPRSTLDVRGGVGVTAASNFGGAVTVASLTSNGAISGTTGTFSSALYSASFNTGGTATVNALVSNGAVNGTDATFSSLQVAGTTTSNVLISNIYGYFGQNVRIDSGNISSTTTSGALVVDGGVGIGGRLNIGGAVYTASRLNAGAEFIANSINSNTNVVATNIQSTGQATVSSLVSNGAVNGTDATFSSLQVAGTTTSNVLISNIYGYFGQNVRIDSANVSTSTTTGALVVDGGIGVGGRLNTGQSIYSGSRINAAGALIGDSINSNTNVVGVNIQSTGQATVASLVSNGAISGTTINGTDATLTSLQVSGTTTSNALFSNVYGYFGQNVRIDSGNVSSTTTTGALVVDGGVGIGGRLNTGQSIYSGSRINAAGALIGDSINSNTNVVGVNLQSTGQATVASLVSNGAVVGTDATFATVQAADSVTSNVLISNIYGYFGQNVRINSANVSTSTTTGALIVDGGVGIGGRVNIGGAVYTASRLNAGSSFIAQSINSNTNVVATNIQSTGAASVASLVSNGAISGTSTTVTDLTTTSIQNSGSTLVQSLNSNTNVVATNLQSTGLTSVASLVVNAGIYTNRLNVATTANVNALTSNTGITVSAGGVTVTGLSRFTGNVSIAGNLNVTGAIFTDNANVLVVQNPIIYVGEDNPADLFDLGIVGSYTTTDYFHTGFVRNKDDDTWTLFDTLPSEPNVITGTVDWGNTFITFGRFKAGNIVVAGNARSTSSTTGTIVINGVGGIGVGGNVNVGGQRSVFTGNILVQGTNASTSTSTGAFIASGGAAIGGALHVGGLIYGASTLNIAGAAQVNSLASNGAVSGTTGTFTGALYGASFNTAGTATVNALVSNGAITGTTITGTAGTFTSIQNSGNERAANIVSNTWIHATQNLTVASSNTSTSTSTGAAVVTGGVGIGGNINVGGTVNSFTGNVGIGVSNPGARLDVTSTTAFSARISGPANVYQDITDGTGTLRLQLLSNSPYITSVGAYPVVVGTNNTERMRIGSTGQVGIGTTSMSYLLDVQTSDGSTIARFKDTDSAHAGIVISGDANGGYVGNKNIGVGAGEALYFQNSINAIRVFTNDTERMRVDSAGNVGIGTSTVQTGYKLQVQGGFAAITKSFVIDHPTKTGYKLRYGSLESPYHGIRLTGEASVVDRVCTVQLPDYVGTLVDRQGVNIQITNIKHGKTLWVDDIDLDRNCFTVATDTTGKFDFFWSFTAIRKDIEPLIVEYEE